MCDACRRVGRVGWPHRRFETRLVLCRILGLEFDAQFGDVLLVGLMGEGKAESEPVHLMLVQPDVELLAGFLANCAARPSAGPVLDADASDIVAPVNLDDPKSARP